MLEPFERDALMSLSASIYFLSKDRLVERENMKMMFQSLHEIIYNRKWQEVMQEVRDFRFSAPLNWILEKRKVFNFSGNAVWVADATAVGSKFTNWRLWVYKNIRPFDDFLCLTNPRWRRPQKVVKRYFRLIERK